MSKIIKCSKCGNRIYIFDDKNSFATVKCNKCGLSVLNIFFPYKNTNILLNQKGQIVEKKNKIKGKKVSNFW